jgi:hypothetical protein
MAEHKHWKADLPADYFGAQHLVDGKDVIVQIADVRTESVRSQQGTEDKLVIYFDGDVKPNKWICNKTNASRIENVLKTPYIDEWVGKKIQLYSEIVSAFGKTGPAIRVREFAPKA